MRKNLLLLALSAIMAIPTLANEECDVIFTSTPWATMGISGDGRYFVGTRQYTEAYRFDVVEERLYVLSATGEYDDMCFSDVSNDGLLIFLNLYRFFRF